MKETRTATFAKKAWELRNGLENSGRGREIETVYDGLVGGKFA
jgi:hypothetical protein